MAEVRLARLAVVVAPFDPASIWRANRHRNLVLPAGPIPHLRGLAHDLVEPGVNEIHELDLRDGAEPVQGHPDRGANDPALAEGRVEHTVRELVDQTLRAPEHAAVPADVLSQKDDSIVAAHLLAQRVVHRLDDVHRGHQVPLRIHSADGSPESGFAFPIRSNLGSSTTAIICSSHCPAFIRSTTWSWIERR